MKQNHFRYSIYSLCVIFTVTASNVLAEESVFCVEGICLSASASKLKGRWASKTVDAACQAASYVEMSSNDKIHENGVLESIVVKFDTEKGEAFAVQNEYYISGAGYNLKEFIEKQVSENTLSKNYSEILSYRYGTQYSESGRQKIFTIGIGKCLESNILGKLIENEDGCFPGSKNYYYRAINVVADMDREMKNAYQKLKCEGKIN